MIACAPFTKSPNWASQQIRFRGSAELKRVVTESVNEFLRPIRARRTEVMADRAYLSEVLAAGNATANLIADRTLAQVRAAMGMSYASSPRSALSG